MERLGIYYLIAIAFLLWGFSIGRYEIFPFQYLKPSLDEISAFIKGNPEGDDTTLWDKLKYDRQEKRKDNRYDYGGFRVREGDFIDTGYLLISRYSKVHSQVIVELVQLNDFVVLHTWIPPINDILKHSKPDQISNTIAGYRAQHPLLLDDGSLVFMSGEGPIVKISKCSTITWVVAEHFHHSIEMTHAGNLVVPLVNLPRMQSFPENLRDDGFATISPDGKVLQRWSVTKILMENGYRGLLMGIGRWERDRIHLNDAQPILMDTGLAKVGDIALSLRHMSTVLLYRPNSNKVVWLRTGPWLNQHDINILDDGTYSVFGNDVFRLEEEGETPLEESSEIYVYNAMTNKVTIPFSNILKSEKMFSATEGRSRILANGDVYIEETDGHRLLRLSQNKVRWDYINKITDNTTGALHWSRYLTADEVNTSWLDESCN